MGNFRGFRNTKNWNALGGLTGRDRDFSNAVINEAKRFHLLRAVEVAAVENHRLFQAAAHFVKVGCAELAPFGQYCQRIGTRERLER